jgi:hypothetical protein
LFVKDRAQAVGLQRTGRLTAKLAIPRQREPRREINIFRFFVQTRAAVSADTTKDVQGWRD